MRKRWFLLLFVPVLIFISAAQSQGSSKNNARRDSSLVNGFKPHSSMFYSLDFGTAQIQTSSAFNNWITRSGYVNNRGFAFSNGASFIGFRNNWMTEINEQFQDIGNNGQLSIENFSFGSGYKILNSKICHIYAIIDLGLNTSAVYPNQTILNELSAYQQPSGSAIMQYAFLANPHLMLFRDITGNLSKRPDFLSKIGLGIVAGYNIEVLQSRWWYGYSDSRPFYAVRVSEIPDSEWNGFYFLGKIGWNFGKE